MKEKRNKPRYNAEFKTFNSQQSCIDVFSKVESLFLQKFFRYNLSDYFHEHLANVEQDLFLKKLKHKQIKQLASECFLTKNSIHLTEFQRKVNDFYSHRSENVEQNQVPFAFKLLHSNHPDLLIEKDELLIVQVRMRAQIEKIQNLPTYFYRELQLCQGQMHPQEKDEEQVLKQLKKYGKNSINLLVVYFGDVNFQLFNQEHYKPCTIRFFNREVQVRIHVFYISRIALLDCFKRLNKLQNLEYINDLLIQLYQFKREKARAKRLKSSRGKHHVAQSNDEQMMRFLWYLKLFSIVSISLVGVGAFILKFLV